MELLLDTHVALFAIAGAARLGERSMSVLMSPESIVYVSAASVWEVAIKHAVNRENMPVPEERFVEVCGQTGFLELPIENEHIFAVKTLARPADAPRHNDPFDRLLIAQAKAEGLCLLTHDGLLEGYSEPCVMLC